MLQNQHYIKLDKLFEGHIHHCVRDGIEHGDAEKTIESFTKAVERFLKYVLTVPNISEHLKKDKESISVDRGKEMKKVEYGSR